jgi:hypothetical protein
LTYGITANFSSFKPLHLPPEPKAVTLKMVALYLSETSDHISTTRHGNQKEDHQLEIYRTQDKVLLENGKARDALGRFTGEKLH